MNDTPAVKYDQPSPMDIVTARVTQLAAILHAVTGDGFAAFADLAPKLQHDYLWAAQSLVDDCATALERTTAPVSSNAGAQ